MIGTFKYVRGSKIPSLFLKFERSGICKAKRSYSFFFQNFPHEGSWLKIKVNK